MHFERLSGFIRFTDVTETERADNTDAKLGVIGSAHRWN
jgi:hypothetical protein